MTPTVSFVEGKFAQFNQQMFDGKLTMPPILLSRARTFVGQCVAKKGRTLFGKPRLYDFRLKFSVMFDLTEREWEDTIIHEMIHYYIHVSGQRDTSAHGRLFRQMMDDINRRFGRQLSISHKSTPEERERLYSAKPVWRIVALVHLADGRRGIKVLPRNRSRVLRYRTQMLRSPEIVQIDLYLTNDPYFNRFPSSSALNVLLANEDDFMPHLEKGEPLKDLL